MNPSKNKPNEVLLDPTFGLLKRRKAVFLIVRHTLGLLVVSLLPSLGLCQVQQASQVTVGAYLNNIQSVDLREHCYAVDIYIWFRWTDPELAPHETMEVVNPCELWGHVRSVIHEQPVTLPDGQFYQVVRIQGKFTRKFFFYNYPFDRQQLTIEIEDAANETNRMIYVADSQLLTVNSELKLPGYSIGPADSQVQVMQYPTAFGDTRKSMPNSYSRVTLSVPIYRPVIASCVKMLLPILCVVIGASIMLRLRVSYVDARIDVGITALLTVVAIQLASNDNMPIVDYLVFMDKIDLCAYAYVLAGLAVVLATIRRLDRGEIESAQRLQRIGFWVITIAFVALIISLTGQAIIQG
jgi:hypothetical protein